MPEWKKVESPITDTAAMRFIMRFMPAIMPMPAPMHRQLSSESNGGSAPSV